MGFRKFMRRCCSGFLAGLTAFSMIGEALPSYAEEAETETETESVITYETSTYTSSSTDNRVGETKFLTQALKLLGAKYTWGGKGLSNQKALPASTVKKSGVDCSGLCAWTLASCGYSSSGYYRNRPVPLDTDDWTRFPSGAKVTKGSSFTWKWKKKVNGTTKTYSESIKTVKAGVASRRYDSENGLDYWQISETKDIQPGTIIVGECYTVSGIFVRSESHAWIYLGEFKNRDAVINALVNKYGVKRSTAEKWTSDGSGDAGTHWRIESTGSSHGGVSDHHVMVDNNKNSSTRYKIYAMDVLKHGADVSKLAQVSIKTSYNSATTSVRIKWKKVSNANGYRIYRKVDGKWKKIATIKSGKTCEYKDIGLESGTKYQYKVKAYSKKNGFTYWGKVSDAKNVTTTPQAVTFNATGAGTNYIRLNWNKVTCDGYIIYQKQADGSYAEIASVENTCTYKISGLEEGTKYTFKIRAYKSDADGNKKYSKYSTKTKTTKTETVTEPTVANQIKILSSKFDSIASSISAFSSSDSTLKYWISDYDQDGYLELNMSETTESGVETYGCCYEVNTTVDGVNAVTWNQWSTNAYVTDEFTNLESSSSSSDSLSCYYDTATGKYYYICYDYSSTEESYLEKTYYAVTMNGNSLEFTELGTISENGENNYSYVDADSTTYSSETDFYTAMKNKFSNMQEMTFEYTKYTDDNSSARAAKMTASAEAFKIAN